MHSLKNLVLIFFALVQVCAWPAFSFSDARLNETINEIRDLTTQLNFETRYPDLAKYESYLEVKRQLENSLRLLRAPISRGLNLACVSKDGDNQRPFVLYSKDDAMKIDGVRFSTLASCESSLVQMARRLKRNQVCASKDGDGLRPFQIFDLLSAKNIVSAGRFPTLAACEDALHGAAETFQYYRFCNSKDGDGLRPFISTTVNASMQVSSGDSHFATLDECKRTL